MAERLQKVLANAGLGSRRQIEEWIREGRLKINDKVAQLGDRVGHNDRIRLNGNLLPASRLQVAQRKVIAYFKPEGEVTTRSDPEGRPTIFTALPKLGKGRWIAVGRLDINTSGLILLTTDGELANRLMHPSRQVEREYAVRILGEVDDAMLKRLARGVELEDGMGKFDAIVDAGGQGANHWYHVILKEGRHREVRRLWESQGVTVSRLIRVRYGPITLDRRLKPGGSIRLTDEQLNQLLETVEMEPGKTHAESHRPRKQHLRSRHRYHKKNTSRST